MHQDELFIGGAWLPAATGRAHRSRVALIPNHLSRRSRPPAQATSTKRSTAARRAFDDRPMAAARARRTHRRHSPTRQDLRRTTARDGRTDHLRDRCADQLRPARPGRAAVDDDDAFSDVAESYPWRETRPGHIRLRHPDFARARRRRRRHRSVEHAAVPHRHQAGARAAGRMLRDPQARARVSAQRAAPRRADRRGGPAAGRGQCVARRRCRRRVSGQTPRRRQGFVHRVDRCGQGRRRRVRAGPAASKPRTRRQVRGDHPGGRRARRGRRRNPSRQACPTAGRSATR